MSNNEFNQFSITELVFGPLRLARDGFARLFESESFGSASDSFSVQNILTFPFRLLWATLAFAVSVWSSSRVASAFLGGLPAILIGLGLLSALTILPWLLKVDVKSLQIYGVQYTRFTEPKRDTTGRLDPNFKLDLSKAMFCGQRLWDATPSENGPKFLYAKAFLPHRRNQAKDIMTTMANTEVKGFVLAHTWLATDAITALLAGKDPEANREFARKHLTLGSGTNEGDITNDSALATLKLAQLYSNEKDYSTSAQILETLFENLAIQIKSRPELISSSINTSQALLQLYKESNAQEAFDRLKPKVVNQLLQFATNRPDYLQTWLYTVNLLVGSQDYAAALEVCDKAMQLVPRRSTQDIDILRTSVYFRQAANVTVVDESTFQKKLLHLTEALESFPLLPEVYAGLIALLKTDVPPESRMTWLENSLLTNKLPVISQVLIGYQAGLDGDMETCQVNWRLAALKNPLAKVVIGLLIKTAMIESKDQLANIRKLLDVALNLFPEDILIKMDLALFAFEDKNYVEAQKLLEEVVKVAPNATLAREALVMTYEAQGLKDQAEIQRQEIQKYKSSTQLLQELR